MNINIFNKEFIGTSLVLFINNHHLIWKKVEGYNLLDRLSLSINI
jgi:hypothetical protein